MKKFSIIAVCCGIVLVLTYAGAQQGPSRGDPPQQFHLATPGQPIAGIPQDEALDIYQRNAEKLRQMPGALSVSFTAEGLVVETFKPEVLPATVEGLPVFPIPPVAKNADLGPLDAVPVNPPEPVPPEEPSHDQEHPGDLALPDCPPGTHREPGEVRCRFDTPPPQDVPKVDLLPPPPGVVVLKPGKVREQADACPENFKEVEGYGGWRFCVDPNNPEPIPPLWSPPINGISYEKALEIHHRHVLELSDLPGVQGVGLGADGIHVSTNDPSVVPKEVEGVPIIIDPPPAGSVQPLFHTTTTNIRPLHGAVAMNDITSGAGQGWGSITGVALSEGKPWLVFPSHLLNNCNQVSPCPPELNTPLNQCPHYVTANQHIIAQPPVFPLPNIGYVQRWTQLSNTVTSPDVAAAFMDSNLIEGDGSVSGDRLVEIGTSSSSAFSGTTIPELPPEGLYVTMRSSVGPPHALTLRVKKVGHLLDGVQFCAGQPMKLGPVIEYEVLGGYFLQGGDSGSPVFDGANRLVGMINACYGTSPGTCTAPLGYGTDIFTIKNYLKFDAWYGTQTANDNTLGVFNTSNAQWYIDNGNGKWDGCTSGAPTKDTDQCVGAYGFTSDTPVTGDWDGNGSITLGVYRENMAGCAPGVPCFLLRNDNSVGAPNITFNTGPASFGSRPVVGKWPGLGTGTKVGVFRPSTGEWLLDNGDWNFNGCGLSDPCFNTPGTQVGDIPFAGDWLGNGQVGVGFFRPSTGTFYFKSALTSGAMTNQSPMVNPNQYTVLPVVGNTWTGIGTKTMFGRYIMSGIPQKPYPYWYLDNGSQTYPSCTEDQCYFFQPAGTVASALRPVAFGKSVVKAN
ncbi:MAG: hypothetical protein AB7G75_09795 [Candidatus Binatia bacterium]